MHIELTPRGFEVIRLPQHPGADEAPVVQQSSLDDSRLWIGERHHVDFEQARELGERLIRWAGFGTLALPEETVEPMRRGLDCTCRTSPQIPDADCPACNDAEVADAR